LFDRLKRSTSRKGKSEPIQTRIDTRPWTSKSKQVKSTISRVWVKFFHIEAIPGAKADNPYFVVACKDTQRWGKFFLLMSLRRSNVFHLSCPLCITCAFFVGEGAMLPTGREIDGTYLDSNEEEIKKHFKKFKDDWTTHGIILMCDSWMGPTGMSIINLRNQVVSFLV
jgi:hypothetical protein